VQICNDIVLSVFASIWTNSPNLEKLHSINCNNELSQISIFPSFDWSLLFL